MARCLEITKIFLIFAKLITETIFKQNYKHMKKSYLLLLMLFVSIVAMGGPVTPDEARQKIAKFMSPRRAGAVSESALKLVATSHYLAQEDVMAASYYVFNVGESQGYVIAAADDWVPAVLGYSDKGKFDPQNMPDNMKAWLQSYDDQMKYLSEHPEAAAPQKTVTGSSINPMLETEWNQGYPYNMFCPMDGSKQCVTGCVATAMAQVMFFWKYPKQTAAEIPGYTSSTKKIEMPAIAAGSSIDWDNMLPKYNGSESDTQQEAVAELMLLCGTAVQMDYTASSSGAASSRVADAWLDWLDYDAATKYENRSKYRLAAWNQKVYDELKVGRPVLYSGQSSGGGHAFVIDGYGGDDYFHVNWGWGGGSNNYFLLSILDPGSSAGIGASSSTDGYSFGQGAIFGAQPNTGQSPVVKVVMTTTQVRSDLGSEFTRSATTEDFSVDVSFNCWNWTGDTHSFDLGCGVFNTDDQLVAAFADYYNPHNFEPNYGFNSKTIQVSFGAGVSSGTYLLKPISRETGTDTWYANDRTDVNFLTASISDNTVMVSVPPEPVFGLTGSIAAAGKQEVGAPLSLTASITNNGTLYNGEIFLVVDDKMVGGRHFDLDAGASDDVVFTYTPTTDGTNNINICTREYSGGGYQYTPFITGSVTVAAAATANLSMYPTTKNAVYEDGKTYVKSDKVVINIEVTNNGSTDYDNDVIVKLYKIIGGNSGTSAGKASKTIQLPAGGFTEVDLELGGLEDGETYFYYVYYKSAGQEVQGYQYSPMFTVKIEGEEPQVEKFTVQGIDVAGTQKTNEDLTITVNVKNEGNVQTGKLYLFVNNTLQKTFDVDITAGETKAYEATYKPTQAGDITIKVTTDEAGETLAGTEAAATKTVTITDPEVVKFTVQGIDVAGTQKTNEDLTITVNVKNEGNVQTGELYLFVNNTLQKTFEVDIAAGETKAYEATYKPTQAGDITIKVTTDEAGETLAGAEAAATKTVTITDPVKADPELAIQANEHFDSELGYFTGKLDQPFNSPELVNPHGVSPIEWTSSNPSVATVDENGVVTLLSIGGTKIKAAFAGNDEYNPGYTEYWLEVADVVGYVIEEDGTVTVVGGDDVTGDVEISGTVEIDGQAYQVTGIGENAFQDNTGITSVTIPDGITTIGANAFEGCSNLMTISIGKGVTNIGEKAFANIGTPTNAPKRAEGEGLLVKCYAESVPKTAADAFEGSPISSGTLLVEDNSVMDYYAATPWGQFGTVMGFNGTTSIKLLVNDMGGGPVSIFSLNGNKLAETQGAGLKQVLNTLPKGVYIVNGQKIVVK